MLTTHPPPPRLAWSAETLQPPLQALLPGLQVQVVASTGSTNTDLLAQARAGDLRPALRVAEQQTAGRGRQGKAWQSSLGASLTFSLSLPLAPADWSGLSLAVGLALADALDPPRAGQPPRIGLKWPNDLLLQEASGPGRKLGGILIETVAAAGQRVVVIGVGLNLQPLPAVDALSWGYASLQELHPTLQAPQVLARLAPPLLTAVLNFAQQGFAPLQARYATRDALRGRLVSTTLADWPEAVADGVADDGALWLRQGDRRQRISSGEVSVRAAAALPGEPR